jgi:transcriptional regulator with XRE-family HTH domain
MIQIVTKKEWLFVSNFATNLEILRKNKGLTQEDMAQFLGMSRPGYHRYEKATGEPTIETLIKLADFFSVSIDELVGRKFNEESDSLKKFLIRKQIDSEIKGIIRETIKEIIDEKEEEIKNIVIGKLNL